MNQKEQGINAEKIFHGENESEAVRLMYRESVGLFSNVIKSKLVPGSYNLADLGSHRGEFLNDLTSLLPEYNFKTIAVDVNEDDLVLNIATEKVISDLTKILISDKSVEVTIARYALAWNNLENQKKILDEIKRITSKIAVIQHQGANPEIPEGLQNSSKLLFGGVIPQLKRENFFFSNPRELEKYMKDIGLNYEILQDRNVPGLSDIFIEKYKLSPEESKKVKDILDGNDYVRQTTWILKF